MANLLANLNEPQLAAVTLPAQHALILAGAGSGKTRVLTTRIAWLISTGQVSPLGILAVTFTNKAAKEMLTRLSGMLPINLRGMWVGTFHGLCNRMLRTHFRDAGLPQSFQILDSQDQLAAIKRMLKVANVDDEKFPPRNVQYFINGNKEEGVRAGAVETTDDYSRRMVELYRLYDEQCQREGVVDFSELLLRCYELLCHNQAIREHYQRRFRHILVDEFQDTNSLQYRWLQVLAGRMTATRSTSKGLGGGAGASGPEADTRHEGAIFAVGDDDQSIYGFRGADVANMAAFEREFKVRNLIKLEQNYRSAGRILTCANALIKNNSHRLGKNLWTDAGDGEPVRVYESMTDTQEAQWLIEEIRGLIAEGHMRSDLAILYRSNAQSRVIEHSLFSAGLPYRVYGGLRFFERAEIKHALAYMRLIENSNDDGAFLRVVNFPTRGIGARSLEQLQDLATTLKCSLFEAASRTSGAAAAKLSGFTRMIEQLRSQTQTLSLSELVEQTIQVSGLLVHYQSEKEGQDRIENLRELVNAAVAFLSEVRVAQDVPANIGVSSAAVPVDAELDRVVDDISEDVSEGVSEDLVEDVVEDVFDGIDLGNDAPDNFAAGAAAQSAINATDPSVIAAVIDADATGVVPQGSPLASFLAHASLESGDNQAGEGTDAVQLMTVHSAKGLEFDAVFMTGLEEGLFPHENSISADDGLEEERRLMYVAITRARQRLYLSFSQTRMLHGQTRYNMKSRFLAELPEDSLKWLTPRQQVSAFREGYGGAWEGMAGRRGIPGYAPGSGSTGKARVDYDSGRLSAAEQRSAQRFDRGVAFRIGQNVAHAKFGEGVVINIEGSGSDARAQVNFGREGVKWLALSVAKLEVRA